ncbi:MAG TPA: J domain-containing protein [Alicyclobacillus sp.]|nr:J domain-containing protein [Alicyclobacillus sp.]
MAQKKKYGRPEQYERKLSNVMERLVVEKYDFNWDRWGCWVQFQYKGQLYRFEHSVEKAKAKGIDLVYGSDAFAQLVLALEDLARIAERGIYDLQSWVEGMKYLPPSTEIPECFRVLGFDSIPSGVDEVTERYRALAKQKHPDVGGSAEEFTKLQRAVEEAKQYFEQRSDGHASA